MYATYADEENYGEMAGWWDPDDLGGTKLDDETFAAGTAFLCLFTSGNEVTFRFSGQVEHGRQIVTDTESAFICNPMPVNFTLGEITAIGSSLGEDQIQFLDPNTANVSLYATYADEENYGEMAGWWDPDDLGGTKLDDTPLPAGAAFLCLFTSGNEVTFEFPDPIPAK